MCRVCALVCVFYIVLNAFLQNGCLFFVILAVVSMGMLQHLHAGFCEVILRALD